MQRRLPTVACLLLHKQSLCATSFWEAWPCEGTVPLAILQHAAAITFTSAVPQLRRMVYFNVTSVVAGRHCHIAFSGFDLQAVYYACPWVQCTINQVHLLYLCCRACYGVLRFIMESGAKGCEVIVSGKLRAQRAKAMKFKDGYMIASGHPAVEYIDGCVRHVMLRQGVLGIKVCSHWNRCFAAIHLSSLCSPFAAAADARLMWPVLCIHMLYSASKLPEMPLFNSHMLMLC